MAYNDFKNDPQNVKFESLAALDSVPEAETYTNKEIEKGFMNLTKNEFLKKVFSLHNPSVIFIGRSILHFWLLATWETCIVDPYMAALHLCSLLSLLKTW